MRWLFALGLLTTAARADSFPYDHEVLDQQAELPCRETWDAGKDHWVYTMTFDRAGHLATRTGGARDISYVTDGRGRVIKATEAGERFPTVTTLTRDGRGRITRRTESHDKKVVEVQRTYDANGSSTARVVGDPREREVRTAAGGRVVKVESISNNRVYSTETYTYDADRLVKITLDDGGALERESFDYDSKGRLIRETRSKQVGGVYKLDQTHEYAYTCGAR